MKRLNASHHAAIRTLALGGTRKQAAEAAGVTETSVYNWLRRDKFQNALDSYTEEAVAAGVRGWKSLQRIAVQRAYQMILDPETPPGVVAALIRSVADKLPLDTPRPNVLILNLEPHHVKVLEDQFGSKEAASEQFVRLLEEAAGE